MKYVYKFLLQIYKDLKNFIIFFAKNINKQVLVILYSIGSDLNHRFHYYIHVSRWYTL